MVNFDNYSELKAIGFDIKRGRNQQKVVCPQTPICNNPNAQNKKDTCVSINVAEGVYNCHKCGLTGTVKKSSAVTRAPLKSYKRPKATGVKKSTSAVIKYFESRSISESTLDKCLVTQKGDDIFFPYLRGKKLVNYKTRPLGKKDFRQAAGAEPIMFNYDNCVDSTEVIVCEGEIDALSFIEAGFIYSTSVNAGAPNATDKNVDKKLLCIDNSYEMFETKAKIYLATDNDPNGRRLERELIRRFGAEVCFKINLGQYKDANEVLVAEGAEVLKQMKEDAQPVPVSGVWQVDDVRETMIDTFKNGKKKGTTTHIKELNSYFTWRTGDVNIWTGYNNEGKTTFLGQLLLLKAIHEGEKTAVFSPENAPPDEFFDDLIHTHVGQTTDKDYNNVMTLDQYTDSMRFINERFFINLPEEQFTVEVLIEKFKYLVRRHGVRHIVFDPWNQIDHDLKLGEREDLYISRVFSKLKRFAVEHDVTMNIVMHQNTPRELTSDGNYRQPSKYNIKGGGTISDKADNVLVVWRPNFKTDKFDTLVTFISDKIKKVKLVGLQGELDFEFDRAKNRYLCQGQDPFSNEFHLTSASMQPIEPNVNFYEKEPQQNDDDENHDAPF